MGGYVLISFDPRARRGRDDSVGTAEWADRVSIHAPAGGATRPARAGRATALFRSTRPQGARRQGPSAQRVTASFDPRARRGRDEASTFKSAPTCVSIHAPAGGATAVFSGSVVPSAFRSTRPQGARRWWQDDPGHCAFRSTRPQGARPAPGRAICGSRGVSIHAPAGGATGRLQPQHPPIDLFRSTRPQGARPPVMDYYDQVAEFRSTRPQGARQTLAGNQLTAAQFRSTRPQGARHDADCVPASVIAFRSTRPQGARLMMTVASTEISTFRSTRPQGARPAAAPRPLSAFVSIHAPAGGATRRSSARRRRLPVSIHAPAGGATIVYEANVGDLIVSIHAPAGGATRGAL